MFLDCNEFDKANTYIEEAKSDATNNACRLARAMEVQAKIWYRQGRIEDAKLEISRALEVFEKLGATADGKRCKGLFRTWNKQ